MSASTPGFVITIGFSVYSVQGIPFSVMVIVSIFHSFLDPLRIICYPCTVLFVFFSLRLGSAAQLPERFFISSCFCRLYCLFGFAALIIQHLLNIVKQIIKILHDNVNRYLDIIKQMLYYSIIQIVWRY